MADGWRQSNAAWDDMENAHKQTNSGSDTICGWGIPIPTNNATASTQSYVPKAPISKTAPLPKPPSHVSVPKAPVSIPPNVVPTTTTPMPVKTQQSENKNNVETEDKSKAQCSTFQVSKESNLMVLSNLNGQASLSLDVLRMLVNHYAQNPGGKSFQDHVEKILFTSGQDIAFVQMETAEAAQRVQNGLNGSIFFEKEVFAAIAPSQIQFIAEGNATITVKLAPLAVQTLPSQTTDSQAVTQKNEQQMGKPVVETNLWVNNKSMVNGNGPEHQQKQQYSTGRGMSMDDSTSADQTTNSWGNANGSQQNQQQRTKSNDILWGRSSKVWDKEPDAWGKANNNSKTNADQANKPSAENGQWRGGLKRNNQGGGRSNCESSERNAAPFANSNRFDNRSQDGGGGNFGGRRGSGTWNSQFQQRENNRSESGERGAGDGNKGGGFSERSGGSSGRGCGMNGYGKNNFDNRGEKNGQHFENKFSGGKNSMLGNPDAGVRRGGGSRGRHGGGSRGGFQSGNDLFGYNPRNNTQQSNFNANKPEKPLQNGFGNSGWEQSSQKIFNNTNGFGGFRSSNESEDNIPSSKVIVLNVGAEAKRHELNKFLLEKNDKLIDMDLQSFISKVGNGPPTPPKAYGFVEFPSIEEATKAIELLKNEEFQGIKLKPMFSRKTTLNLNPNVVREYKHRNHYGEGGDNVSIGSGNGNNANSGHVSPHLSPNKSPKKEPSAEKIHPKTEEQQTKEDKRMEKKEEEVKKIDYHKLVEKAEEKENGVANGATDEAKPKEGGEDVERVGQQKVDEKVDEERNEKDNVVVGADEVKTTKKKEEKLQKVIKVEPDESLVENKVEEKNENVDEKIEQQKVDNDEKEGKESGKDNDVGEVTTIQKEVDEQPQQKMESESEDSEKLQEDELVGTEDYADIGPPLY